MSIVAIDLGGTAIKGGLFAQGKLVKEAKRPTEASKGRDALLDSLAALAKGLGDDRLEAVGLSTAGEVDPKEGKIVYATDNLPGWTGTPVAEILSERLGVPVRVENDAIAALLGEMSQDASLGDDVTMLTFGTGVGGASCVHGLIRREKRCEWGHRVIIEGGRPCNCGKRGCAEAYLSATAFSKDASALGYPSPLALAEAARKGEEGAISLVVLFQERLSLLLDLILKEVSPKVILLGGGLMGSYDVLAKPLEGAYPICPAKLGNRAGVYGAYSLWKEGVKHA